MAGKQIVTGVTSATFVLKDGGFTIVNQGEEVPDNIADGQLEHKRAAGAFDEPKETDWQTLASVGTVPVDAGLRQEAAEQAVEQSTAPESEK